MPRNIKIGGIYASVFARNEQFLRATGQSIQAITRQRQVQRQLNQSAYRLRQSFRRLTSGFAAFAGVAGVGAAIGSMKQAVTQASELALVLDRQAKTLDVQPATYQRLSKSIKLFGGDQEDLFDVMKELQVRIVEAGTGAAVAIEAFSVAGVDFNKHIEENTSALDLFYDYVDGIKRLADEGNQALANFVSNELLGDIGTRFTPFFAEGSEAIQELGKQFEIYTDEQLTALLNLRQGVITATEEVSTAKSRIIADNAVVFQELIDLGTKIIPVAFQGALTVIEFFQNNVILARLSLGLLAARLLKGLGLTRFIGNLISATVFLAAGRNAVAFFTSALIAMRVVLETIGRVGFVLILTELVAWFIRLRGEGNSTGEALRIMWEKVKGFARATFKFLGDVARVTLDDINANFKILGDGIGDIFNIIWESIRDTFIRITQTIFESINRARASFFDWVASMLESLQDFVNNNEIIFNKVQAAVEFVLSTIKTAFTNAFVFIKKVAGDNINFIIGFFDKLATAYTTGLNALIYAYNLVAPEVLEIPPITFDLSDAYANLDETKYAVFQTYDEILAGIKDRGGTSALLDGPINIIRTLEESAIASADANKAIVESFEGSPGIVDLLTASVANLTKSFDDQDKATKGQVKALTLDYLTQIGVLQLLQGEYVAVGDAASESAEAQADAIRSSFQAVLDEAIAATEAWNKANKDREEDSEDNAEKIKTIHEKLTEDLNSAYASAIGSFSTMIGNIVVGFEDAGEAAKRFAKTLISQVVAAFVKSGIYRIISAVFGIPVASIPGFQFGGLAERGLAVVGEAGPELVDFRSPGRVYTNEQLGDAIGSGGGGNNFYFQPNIYSSDGAAVTKALQDAYPIFEQQITRAIRSDLSSNSSTRSAIRR